MPSGEKSEVKTTPEVTGDERTDHGIENTAAPEGGILEPETGEPEVGPVSDEEPNEGAKEDGGGAPRERHTQTVVPTLPTQGNANDSQVRGEPYTLQEPDPKSTDAPSASEPSPAGTNTTPVAVPDEAPKG